jgi:hypothetical protein
MNDNHPPSKREAFLRGLTLWLERLTAVVLVVVIAVVGWMVCVAAEPRWLRLRSVEEEAVAVLGILSLALVLVTVVALLHTRRSGS